MLFIQILRAYYDDEYYDEEIEKVIGKVRKDKTFITLSQELYVLGIQYSLRLVTIHRGSQADEGHYYCYIRDPFSAAKGAIWHKMNDSSSSIVDLPKTSSGASLYIYERHDVTTNAMLQQLESLRATVLRREHKKPEGLFIGGEEQNIVRQFLDDEVPPTSSTSH